jgi:hypothetical protein
METSRTVTQPRARPSHADGKQASSRGSLYAQPWARYAPCMKRLRVLLERLRAVRRPPTGPLTTAEKATAEELRQETLLKDNERIEREQREATAVTASCRHH